jgi:transglutaminase-like putative cysteine protease
MTILTEEATTPDGKFLRSRMESSVSNLSASAVLEGDSLIYTSSAGGSTRHQSMPWNPNAVTEKVVRQRVASWLDGDEKETAVTVFDISEGGFRTQRLVRGDKKKVPFGESEIQVIEVEEFDEGAETATSSTWYETGSNHEPVRTLVRQLGVEIEIARVTAAELEATTIEPSFDIIKQSMVPCPGFPIPASRMESVTLVLDFPGTLPSKSMSAPSQLEEKRGDNSVTLKLTRGTADKETVDEAKREVFLKPDRFVQSDMSELKAVADSLKSSTNSKNPWVLARAVASWVDGHITHKGMEHGYSSAIDVYKSRAGDCTEHSLLTTAVLRAAGIPARPVVGLAYSERDKAFVGHMWVEAYVDQWRTLDALNLGLDPIRIRVYAPESSEGLGERDLMRAYGVMAGVKIHATGQQARK